MSDEEILNLYWARNPDAIIAAREKYDRECYGLAMGILSDDNMASYAVMQAHKDVWNAIPPNRPKNLKAFLLRMTRNAAMALLFSNCTTFNCEKIRQIDEEISGWSVDTSLSDSELGSIIDNFLRTLTDTEQIMFICRYWYFDSSNEISENVNMPVRKIHSALRTIGKQLLSRVMEVEKIIEE